MDSNLQSPTYVQHPASWPRRKGLTLLIARTTIYSRLQNNLCAAENVELDHEGKESIPISVARRLDRRPPAGTHNSQVYFPAISDLAVSTCSAPCVESVPWRVVAGRCACTYVAAIIKLRILLPSSSVLRLGPDSELQVSNLTRPSGTYYLLRAVGSVSRISFHPC